MRGIGLSVPDLEHATWDSTTVWPSETIAGWVRLESAQIRPGVYQVGRGRDFQHDTELV